MRVRCAPMKFRSIAVLSVACAVSASHLDNLPTASTPIASPAPPVPAPSLPTSVPGVLSVAMPIDGADIASAAFGMLPFGYHGGGHTEHGHAGWDIEYRIGAPVRAAAMGTVISIEPDLNSLGRTTVVLEHLVGEHVYRTHYGNLASVAGDVVIDELVLAGQVVGVAGTVTTTVLDATATYAMSHFQLDDLEFHREITSPKAVSPEPFLTAAGKALFDRIWADAIYFQELVEPFATNPRETTVTQRTWMRAGGDGPAGIRFTRTGGAYAYELLTESGTVIEAGTATLRRQAGFGAIDLLASTATRLGVFDITSNELRFAVSSPGLARPADLSSASIYRTR